MDTLTPDPSHDKAQTLHRLHDGSTPLVLVNAWDAGSARVIERAGASVIATTSAGMAWSLGYADGEQIPPDEFLSACSRICRATRLPVSVDIERGFGRSVDDVRDLVQALIGLGVVGVNIEDGVAPDTQMLRPADVVCERIAALRELATRARLHLFINARTDAYLGGTDDPARRFDEALRRAQLFAHAGADGIFVPGLFQLDDVTRLASEIALPLNIYAGHRGVPNVAALAAAGVRRISLGCGPLQSALGLLERIATETLQLGRCDTMVAGMADAGELNRLFSLPQPTHE